MRKLTSAYLAGIIDGDGYISILKTKRGTKKSFHSSRDYIYVPVVKVAMVDKEFIQWLHTSFGGNFETRPAFNNNRESYCWTLRKALVEDFLHDIYPYLRIKKRQAELVFKFKNLNLGAGKTIDDANWAKRDDLYEQIRSLNKRGAA